MQSKSCRQKAPLLFLGWNDTNAVWVVHQATLKFGLVWLRLFPSAVVAAAAVQGGFVVFVRTFVLTRIGSYTDTAVTHHKTRKGQYQYPGNTAGERPALQGTRSGFNSSIKAYFWEDRARKSTNGKPDCQRSPGRGRVESVACTGGTFPAQSHRRHRRHADDRPDR